jgi:hypothetical protein
MFAAIRFGNLSPADQINFRELLDKCRNARTTLKAERDAHDIGTIAHDVPEPVVDALKQRLERARMLGSKARPGQPNPFSADSHLSEFEAWNDARDEVLLINGPSYGVERGAA